MKRSKLIRHLEKNGCYLLREGSSHSLFFNPHNNAISTVPRHSEVKKFTSQKICKDLGIAMPHEN
ncbi:MAG: type II toxin-antitoxin system HicA family toxin [Bacteroidetes bacterium]|nr:type II toxin-antitoxin system HicA family toxin [Bacteroidota bacterium]